MNKSKFFTSTAVVAIVALGVAGCHQASSWPELSNVVPCVNLPTQIPAEELGAFFEELRCDARGSTVVFPDGKTKPIKSQLTTSTAGDDRDDGVRLQHFVHRRRCHFLWRHQSIADQQLFALHHQLQGRWWLPPIGKRSRHRESPVSIRTEPVRPMLLVVALARLLKVNRAFSGSLSDPAKR